MKEEKRLRDSLYIFLKSSVLTCYMLHATCYMLRPEKLSARRTLEAARYEIRTFYQSADAGRPQATYSTISRCISMIFTTHFVLYVSALHSLVSASHSLVSARRIHILCPLQFRKARFNGIVE